MVLAEHHRFERGVMDGVVLGDHVGGAVNPQAVVALNRADVVVVDFNVGRTDAKARTAACTGNGVARGGDARSIVSRDAGTFAGRDLVVVDVEHVLDVTGLLERVGVNSVAQGVHGGVGQPP